MPGILNCLLPRIIIEVIPIAQQEKVKVSLSSIDPNILTLKQITDWLVTHNYL